jgi:hypothetical protein
MSVVEASAQESTWRIWERMIAANLRQAAEAAAETSNESSSCSGTPQFRPQSVILVLPRELQIAMNDNLGIE